MLHNRCLIFAASFMFCLTIIVLAAESVLAQADRICISEIKITGEDDGPFGPRLEVEVHLFESGINTFLGCSGFQSGLICANESDVLYQVEAYFQKPGGGFVTYDDVRNKIIYLDVIEDDSNPCPGPIVPADDRVGTSTHFPGSNLQTPQVMSFVDVKHLKISRAMTPPAAPNSPRLSIHEITFGNWTGSFPDLELHVYDAGTDLFLGCAGRNSGMANVDLADSLYHVQAFFQRPVRGDREVTYDDVKNRNIYLVAIDDYEDMCPCQHDRFEGNLGRSQAFAGSLLKTPQVLRFGNVTHLMLCVDSTAAVKPEVASSQPIGAEFWVDVTVDSLPKLVELGFEVSFTNTSFLDVVNAVRGPLLGPESDFSFIVDEANGKVIIKLSRKAGQGGVNSSGVAARLRFKSLAPTPPGTVGVFTVSKAAAKDSDNKPIPLTLSCGIATTIIGAPFVPTLALPLDGATGLAVNPRLSWNAAVGAASYRVQVATDLSFSTRVVDQRAITSVSYAVSGLANSTAYYWRVNARNGAGTSVWSDARRFKTTLAAPTLALPANGAIGQPAVLTLGWNPSTGATTYRLQVSTSSGFTTRVVDDSTLASNLRQIGPLTNNTTYYWRVNAKNAEGTSPWSSVWQFKTGTVVVVETAEENSAPKEFALNPNYPNPFNPSTMLKYELPQRADVRLEIFDLMGRHVRTLVNQAQQAGRYAITWDGRNEQGQAVASGTFLYQLRAGNFMQTKRMALVR